MIKWAVVFNLAFVALVKGATDTDEPLLKSISESLHDCYEDADKTIKVESSEAAFESLITNDLNPPRITKCMRYCIMISHKLYNDDGSKNVPEILAFLKKVYPKVSDGDKENAIEESIEKCFEDDTTKDRCDLAHDTSMCIISDLVAQGIDVTLHWSLE